MGDVVLEADRAGQPHLQRVHTLPKEDAPRRQLLRVAPAEPLAEEKDDRPEDVARHRVADEEHALAAHALGSVAQLAELAARRRAARRATTERRRRVGSTGLARAGSPRGRPRQSAEAPDPARVVLGVRTTRPTTRLAAGPLCIPFCSTRRAVARSCCTGGAREPRRRSPPLPRASPRALGCRARNCRILGGSRQVDSHLGRSSKQQRTASQLDAVVQRVVGARMRASAPQGCATAAEPVPIRSHLCTRWRRKRSLARVERYHGSVCTHTLYETSDPCAPAACAMRGHSGRTNQRQFAATAPKMPLGPR